MDADFDDYRHLTAALKMESASVASYLSPSESICGFGPPALRLPPVLLTHRQSLLFSQIENEDKMPP